MENINEDYFYDITGSVQVGDNKNIVLESIPMGIPYEIYQQSLTWTGPDALTNDVAKNQGIDKISPLFNITYATLPEDFGK